MTRLNKRLVELGLAPSRRAADSLIASGVVSINGHIVEELGTKVEATDKVQANGNSGEQRDHVYIAFHKPKGYVCTHRGQTERQKTIFELLPKNFASLKVAGRLDKDSQGLMVLSSDGDFIQRISHPSNSKVKTYLVTLDKPVKAADRTKLSAGIKLRDGVSHFDTISYIRSTQLRITMQEGRNRQIRRTFEALDYSVRQLERTRIGALELGMLKSGAHRFIKPEDIA